MRKISTKSSAFLYLENHSIGELFSRYKKRRIVARLRVSGSLVLPNIVFQITQTRFVVVNKRLRVFCIREADNIAFLGFVKTDKARQPCHLRNLDQGVVIILAVVYV